MTPKSFVSTLARVDMPTVFNPYSDICDIFDRRDAAIRRRKNLRAFLEAALDTNVNTIWVARDLGYRGGRRTGIPLTDEVHLDCASRMLNGARLQRATAGPLVAERTAATVWRTLLQISEPVILWNVFPFHPHEQDNPMSNRCHTRAERQTTLPLLQSLISMFRPSKLVAIGRDAQSATEGLGVPVVGVRHPSYGGQGEFVESMYRLYDVAVNPREKGQATFDIINNASMVA